MNAKRALVIAAILTTLMSLASLAYAGTPVTEDDCMRGGGAVFLGANGRECSGGTFDRRLVV